MCNLAPAFIQNEVTWQLHARTISGPLCVNGVYVTEDPRVKCENIWQRRCWQKSLGGEEAGGDFAEKRPQRSDAMQACMEHM